VQLLVLGEAVAGLEHQGPVVRKAALSTYSLVSPAWRVRRSDLFPPGRRCE
jgi:hypothetical protein